MTPAPPLNPYPAYFTVITRRDPRGWVCWCPDLPGLIASAQTRDASIAAERSLIVRHLQTLQSLSIPLPPTKSLAAIVDMPIDLLMTGPPEN